MHIYCIMCAKLNVLFSNKYVKDIKSGCQNYLPKNNQDQDIFYIIGNFVCWISLKTRLVVCHIYLVEQKTRVLKMK